MSKRALEARVVRNTATVTLSLLSPSYRRLVTGESSSQMLAVPMSVKSGVYTTKLPLSSRINALLVTRVVVSISRTARGTH